MGRAKVIPLPMNDVTLRKKIAAIAADSARVQVSNHAKQRMRERKISLPQVLKVLEGGTISEPAHQNVHGNWQCTLERLVAGDRLKVAAAFVENDGEAVVVITVII